MKQDNQLIQIFPAREQQLPTNWPRARRASRLEIAASLLRLLIVLAALFAVLLNENDKFSQKNSSHQESVVLFKSPLPGIATLTRPFIP